jgi:hypothetical protein
MIFLATVQYCREASKQSRELGDPYDLKERGEKKERFV